MEIERKIKAVIRDVHNFPKPGIVFKDITPIMLDPTLSKEMIEELKTQVKNLSITKVAGIESRGFLFGYPLAMALNLPFVLIRKEGKLPYEKVSQSYELEYGSATIEMHIDAVQKEDKVLVHDDLLATGGSASATAAMICKQGAAIAGFSFVVSLDFLNGSEKIKQFSKNILTLARY